MKYTVTDEQGYNCREFRTWKELVREIAGKHYSSGSYSMLLAGNHYVYANGSMLTSVHRLNNWLSDNEYYNYPLTLAGFKKWAENTPNN
jgi:hypothetical protein